MFGFQWHLTNHCNFRCQHCYQNDFGAVGPLDVDAPPGRLPSARETAARILGALQGESCAINLTGGEPLLFPHLIELLEELHRHPNFTKAGLITNGSVTSESLLDKLAAFPRLSMIQISLESGKAEINDRIRGPGHLAMLRRHIPLYRERLRKPISLMVTLSRRNAQTLDETIAFARELGVSGLMFERFVPMGQGLQMASEVLSAGDWLQITRTILQDARLDLDPFSLVSCRAFRLWFDRPAEDALDGARCNLGRDSMALMPDGTVYPCRRLPIPVGNIHREDFSRIRQRLAMWEPSALRGKLEGPLCGLCPQDDCPGCRALANALTGNALTDDLQCLLQLL